MSMNWFEVGNVKNAPWLKPTWKEKLPLVWREPETSTLTLGLMNDKRVFWKGLSVVPLKAIPVGLKKEVVCATGSVRVPRKERSGTSPLNVNVPLLP